MKKLLLLLLPSLWTSACATTTTNTTTTPTPLTLRRAALKTALPPEDQAGLTPQQQAWLADNCFGGAPKSMVPFGPTQVIVREGYALRHANLDKIPLWVCEHIEAGELADHTPHDGSWAADPELVASKAPHAVDGDYKGSGYDRGHMSPNANFKDKTLRGQTYFFSNAVPQNGMLNGGLWAKLEKQARAWSKSSTDGVWVVTGPLFWDPLEEDAATANGDVPYSVIGDGVAVPTHVYKVLLRKTASGPEGIAFVVENAKPSSSAPADAIVSIDWLEERVGLDFAPDESFDEAVTSPLWP